MYELLGRAAYYSLRPLIHLFIRNTRRAYVVIRHDGKILVVKNVLGSGKWHLPGGGCHASESFAEGASREVKEEVGITVLPDDLMDISGHSFRSKRDFEYHLFGFEASKPPTTMADRFEILEIGWVLPQELDESNAGESLLQAISLLPARVAQ